MQLYNTVCLYNPVWVDLVQSGRSDFVIANTLVDFMNNLSDPRRSVYFDQNLAGIYEGGTCKTRFLTLNVSSRVRPYKSSIFIRLRRSKLLFSRCQEVLFQELLL
jgi:hypothetical protein